jgi:hypothetical protein
MAQLNKSQLSALTDNYIFENTTELVTATHVNELIHDIIDSYPNSIDNPPVFISGTSGNYSIRAKNPSNINAIGDYSYAEGYNTSATGSTSHAEGDSTTAYGESSHVEGNASITYGAYSHAEGLQTFAIGDSSHSEGEATIASGYTSHSEGLQTFANGDYSHAGGQYSSANGTNSFVHGNNSQANGESTIVLGDNITASGDNTTYVDNLNIKTIPSGISVNNIGYDSDGNIIQGTTGGGGSLNSTEIAFGSSSNTITSSSSLIWKNNRLGIGIDPQGVFDVLGASNTRIILNDASNYMQLYGSSGDDTIYFDYSNHVLYIYAGDNSSYQQSSSAFDFYNGVFSIHNLGGNGDGLVGVDNSGLLNFTSLSTFSTGDTYTTGFTYSDNVLSIKQNLDQPQLNVLIDTMTGLTVNGTLSATTFVGGFPVLTLDEVLIEGNISSQEIIISDLINYESRFQHVGILWVNLSTSGSVNLNFSSVVNNLQIDIPSDKTSGTYVMALTSDIANRNISSAPIGSTDDSLYYNIGAEVVVAGTNDNYLCLNNTTTAAIWVNKNSEYTPSYSSAGGSSITSYPSMYVIDGDYITIYFRFDIAFGVFTLDTVTMDISLPTNGSNAILPLNNFASNNVVHGSTSTDTGVNDWIYINMYSSSGNKVIVLDLRVTAPSTSGTVTGSVRFKWNN